MVIEILKPNRILNLAQLAASYLTKKQIKLWAKLLKILIIQPQREA